MSTLPGAKTGTVLEVEFLSKLGEGAFGQVYKARDLNTGQVSRYLAKQATLSYSWL